MQGLDVGAWLRGLDLAQYEATFHDSEIDGEALADLTESDLEKLGIPLGHRKRLLRAIQVLNAQGPGLRPSPPGPTLQQMALEAQRRQLTVMFCDLVGSTELSARLDPEEMHEVIGAYHRCATDCIERTGGFVAKYMGDGVLAYFGYPQAHEDDAERAIHAGLLLTEATPKLPTRHGEPLAVRVGIATGVAVVGELVGAGAAEERAVVGDTPNLAARLQGVAGPNRVVVSHTTRRLAAGLFDYRDLGALSLKGLNLEEPAWEVVGANAAADRFKARHELDPAPMVGRDREVQQVLALWRRCLGGAGQLVGLIGEPGIGKSRLVYAIRKEVAHEAHIWLEGGGAQVFRNTPFYAVSQMIRRLLGRARRLSPEGYLRRLERALRVVGMDADYALPLIADVIGVRTPDTHAPLTMSADQRRSLLISTLAEWLLKTAARWPTAMVVEDLHWVDPSTLELLDYLIERAPSARLLMLYTTRSDFRAPWPGGELHAQILLNRLDRDSLRRLVVTAGGRELSNDLVEKVIARADGVPLFAEELARLISERKGRAQDREIPSTLSDLLMARLDQLGPAKEVAQIASVLGSEFHLRLLRAVSGAAEPSLRTALEKLIAADVLMARGAPPIQTYAFKHSLIHDAAYEALLRSQRRELHRRAATVIAETFPEIATAQPEVLAQHWAGAGEPERAFEAWQQAGRSATERRAFKEAEQAYHRALEILKTLPDAPTHAERELALQSSLVGVLQITRGYSAPQTIAANARARELAERGGDLSQQVLQASLHWGALSSAGDYLAARTLANQLLLLARAEGSPDALGAAHMIQMTSRYRTGDLIGADEAFEGGQRYFTTPEFCRRPGMPAQTFGNAALNACIMGKPAEARRRVDQALAVSRDSDSPYDMAFAQYMASMHAILASEPAEAEDLARRSNHLSVERGFPQFMATTRIVLGRARAELGEPAEGLTLIRDGLTAMAETGFRVGATMYLSWLAEAQALGGALDDALGTLDEALSTNPQELFFRPESLRLRADFRARKGDVGGALIDYRDAIGLSKTMGAKLFHSRASIGLAALGELQTA